MSRTPPTPARTFWAVLLLPAACWAGGCVGGGQPAADGIPVRRLPAEVFGRPKADLQPVPLTLLRPKEPDAYRVDKGDVLTVYAEDVLGVRGVIPVQVNPSPGAEKPAAQGYPVTVQDDGTIAIPDVPPIPVRGKTVAEVRDAVVKAITVDKKLIVPGKERVTVDLLKKRQYRVLVVREDGDGPGGGFTLLLDAGRNDLLEALTRTGGLPGPGAKPEAVIRRDDPKRAVVVVPLRAPAGESVAIAPDDIVLTDGDTVLIEARPAETFSVVGGPGCGQFALPRDADLRVVGALAQATCPTPACGWVTVLRSAGCGRQVPIKVDLAEALRDPRENILVLPGDVIVLPGCGPGKCGGPRSPLPGWLTPCGPHRWPVTRAEACGVCQY